jgi:AP2-associated kinase
MWCEVDGSVLELDWKLDFRSRGSSTSTSHGYAFRQASKAEPFEPVVPQSVKAPTEMFAPPKNPHRKSSTLFGTDALSPTKPENPSPPKPPYPGIGKLIDQWQKKTAEADYQTTLAGKRGSLYPNELELYMEMMD